MGFTPRYHELTQIPFGWMPPLVEKVDLRTLDLLVNDPEIIERVGEDLVGSVVESVLFGWLTIENETGKIVSRRWDSDGWDAIRKGRETEINKVDLDQYKSLRKDSDLGIFTMILANNYGMNSEELKSIPYKPTGEQFALLKKHMVSKEYALQYMQFGLLPEVIVDQLVRAAGVSVETRLRYKSILIYPNERLTEDEIGILDRAGMKPAFLEEIIPSPYLRSSEYKKQVISLVKENKLTGDVYTQWREAGIHPLDIIFGLSRGLSMSQIQRAKSLGNDASQLYNDSNPLYLELLSEVIQQKQVTTK